MKSSKKILQKVEDSYLKFSEHSKTRWFRGVLQSLDVDLNSNGGIRINLGQFLERFLFTQADIISQERVESSVRELNNKLKLINIDHKELKERLEEFAKLFLRFYAMTGSQASGELRNAYVNQMANFFDERNAEESNNLFYQQLLFRLSAQHYSILVYAEQIFGKDAGQRFENSKSLREAIRDKFIKQGLEEAVIEGIIKDLDAMGLMNSTQSSLFGGDLHQLFVTKLGSKLLSQVEDIKK